MGTRLPWTTPAEEDSTGTKMASALQVAIDSHNVQETARLLETSPVSSFLSEKNWQEEVSARDNEDRVALHYAAEVADLPTTKEILDKDPSLLDCSDKNGSVPTPLLQFPATLHS